MPKEPIAHHTTLRYEDGAIHYKDDNLSVEEPLEIVIDDYPYAITMRLPGDDINLVRGFLFTEGVIGTGLDATSIAHCQGHMGEGRVLVTLAPGQARKDGFYRQRNEYLSKSSCGVCGKTTLDEIYTDIPPVTARDTFPFRDVIDCMATVSRQKAIFALTGSTHSASLFTRGRELLAFAEDVGRHNAFDKAIGAVVGAGREAEAAMAIVSSRLSFEMVQKAGMIGVQVLAGISAPTLLAIQFAERCNMTLIGFLRGTKMNVYTHVDRMV
ncbi:MAG: formate dehydrogenase accessory sulfurtransferase FdhD [Desulfovibrionaceae bacterium]